MQWGFPVICIVLHGDVHSDACISGYCRYTASIQLLPVHSKHPVTAGTQQAPNYCWYTASIQLLPVHSKHPVTASTQQASSYCWYTASIQLLPVHSKHPVTTLLIADYSWGYCLVASFETTYTFQPSEPNAHSMINTNHTWSKITIFAGLIHNNETENSMICSWPTNRAHIVHRKGINL